MSNETPYQVAPQVEALQQERANCVAYGNDRRVAQIDRQLADLGVKQDAAEKRGAATENGNESKRSAPPKGRRAKESNQAAAEGSSEA